MTWSLCTYRVGVMWLALSIDNATGALNLVTSWDPPQFHNTDALRKNIANYMTKLASQWKPRVVNLQHRSKWQFTESLQSSVIWLTARTKQDTACICWFESITVTIGSAYFTIEFPSIHSERTNWYQAWISKRVKDNYKSIWWQNKHSKCAPECDWGYVRPGFHRLRCFDAQPDIIDEISLNSRYAVPDIPYSIAANVTTDELNTLVNTLLQEDGEHKAVEFDFLVLSEFLR